MEVLKHLEEYSNVAKDASKDLKASIWHLTKSRKRYQGGFLASVDSSYSAGELREEFSALSVLEIGEPTLRDEADSVGNLVDDAFQWKLVDVAKQREESKTQPKSETGLRHRNQKAKQPETKSPMQEEDLKSIDPLSLFGGLTPQDLRRAQTSAKKALEKYVDAANKVATIQALLASKR